MIAGKSAPSPIGYNEFCRVAGQCVFGATIFVPLHIMDWPSADSADSTALAPALAWWRVRGRVMCHLVEAHVRAVQHQYAYAAHVDVKYASLPPDALAAGVTPTALMPAGYFAAPRAEGRVLFVAPDRGPEFDACIAAAQGQLCLVLHSTAPGGATGAPDVSGTLHGPPEAVECAVAGARQLLTAAPLTALRRRDYTTAEGARICDIELSRGSYDLMRGAPGLVEGREVRGIGRHLAAEDRMLCYTLLSPAADTAVCFAYDELVAEALLNGTHSTGTHSTKTHSTETHSAETHSTKTHSTKTHSTDAASAGCPGLIRCHLIGPTALVSIALAWAQKRYQP
jgi:hypothetical protein